MSEVLDSNSVLQNGKYTIKRVLGQGGFGITYEAIQSGLNRKVAIKEFFMNGYCVRNNVTHQVLASTDSNHKIVDIYRQKFLKEARIIASLNHPNIIKIYDVFLENGTVYYAMQYISRGLLDSINNDWPKLELFKHIEKYICDIAAALKYLHSRVEPLNHLDVKPNNILIDEDNRAVLIDFGISKVYDIWGEQLSGTPPGLSYGYSPIEQYSVEGISSFSPAVDIYALGATLYRLATGSMPPDALYVLRNGLPKIPNDVPSNICNAIIKSMQPISEDRPQNIDFFLGILKGQRGPSIQTNYNKPLGEGQLSNGHNYVDLGLSVLWADCNIGAHTPYERGDLYAWGEVQKKERYSWGNYAFCRSDYSTANWITKYNTINDVGYLDNITQLELIDDTAQRQWGGRWHIPNKEQWEELIEQCKWTWSPSNRTGIDGYRITSKINNNTIFLPVTRPSSYSLSYDEGYWSSSLVISSPKYAYRLLLDSDMKCFRNGARYLGNAIRCVIDKDDL